MPNLRHESSSQSLEKQSDEGRHRGDVATETANKGKKTSNEGDGAEEQCNQVESEHEPREIVVLLRAKELLRDASLGAKVARRIEWKRRLGRTTVGIETILSAADGEKGPSRRVERARDAAGRCLQEVEFVQGRAVHAAS